MERKRSSRKIRKRMSDEWLQNNRAGNLLVDLLRLDQPGKGKTELFQELSFLSSSQNKGAVRAYYVRKMTIILLMLVTGIGLTVAGYVVYRSTGTAEETQILERPGYGAGDRKESLSVWIEGERQAQEMEVTVQERKYTQQQKDELLLAAEQEIERIFLGENESADEVRYDLCFPQNMMNGAVEITWMTVPYGVIGEDGSILKAEDEQGTLTEITATLTCDEKQNVYTSYVKVFPALLTDEERLYQAVREEVEQADKKGSYDKDLKLPLSVDGKVLTWMKPADNPAQTILFLSLLMILCVYVQMDNQVHKKAEERRQQLLLDYPDLMWKMMMLLGAGLSIKGTFTRISDEYLRERKQQNRKKGKRQIRYVYEEVTCACYEMQSGISEAQAYERFGKRCQLPEYIRIGSVLSQNLKKGARGLTSLLETEAEASLNERRNNARQIGEKAGTKLLLPMVLMLGVVLAILMVPAFLSF